MSFVSLLFGFSGRINRAQYWLGCVIAGVGGAMLLFLLTALTMPAGGYPKTPEGMTHFISSVSFAFGLPMLLMGWVATALQTKRFHDRGRSGLWILLPMLPMAMIMVTLVSGIAAGQHPGQVMASLGMWLIILQLINLFMFVDLGCMPSKGPNKYGNPPGGGISGGGAPMAPLPGQSSAPAKTSVAVPGMNTASLGAAESAMEQAIAARARAAKEVVRTPAPAPASAAAAPSAGLRQASGGSFGRKAAT